MDVTFCEEQSDALAARLKGEFTEAPLEGLLMETPPEVVVGAEVPLPTMIATSATQEDPEFPQAFTCRVC